MTLAFEMKEGGCFEKLRQNVNFRNVGSAIQVGMCTCTCFENLKTGFLATGPMLLSTKHMRHFIWVFTVCKSTHFTSIHFKLYKDLTSNLASVISTISHRPWSGPLITSGDVSARIKLLVSIRENTLMVVIKLTIMSDHLPQM